MSHLVLSKMSFNSADDTHQIMAAKIEQATEYKARGMTILDDYSMQALACHDEINVLQTPSTVRKLDSQKAS